MLWLMISLEMLFNAIMSSVLTHYQVMYDTLLIEVFMDFLMLYIL